MNLRDIERVVNTWSEEYARLSALPLIHHVQIFENRGTMMGASNPHPHCQIWANATVPTAPLREHGSFEEYRLGHGTCLLCDYVRLELECKERIVCENEHFLAVVPFWAVWPFETLIVSKRHLSGMPMLEASERTALADILKRLTTRYDNLFETSFPYSMGFHQRSGDGEHSEWHFHAHFLPAIISFRDRAEFSVGYEMLAMPQRDITAETAAERLRSLPEQHYLEKS